MFWRFGLQQDWSSHSSPERPHNTITSSIKQLKHILIALTSKHWEHQQSEKWWKMTPMTLVTEKTLCTTSRNFFTEHLLTIHTLSPQSIESILLNPWMKRMDGRKRMKGQCNVIETFQNKYTNYLKLSLLLRYLRYLFSWPTCTSSLRLFSLVPSSLSDLFCEHFLLCSASSWMYRGVM